MSSQHRFTRVVTLTVGVPAAVAKDAVFTFGTFSKVKSLANLFAAGCSSVNGRG